MTSQILQHNSNIFTFHFISRKPKDIRDKTSAVGEDGYVERKNKEGGVHELGKLRTNHPSPDTVVQDISDDTNGHTYEVMIEDGHCANVDETYEDVNSERVSSRITRIEGISIGGEESADISSFGNGIDGNVYTYADIPRGGITK